MGRARKERRQITCWCQAYGFPHRIIGGRCNGCDWVESYFQYERYSCEHCNSGGGGSCDVAEGRERLQYCDGLRNARLRPSGIRHPVDLDRVHSVPDWSDDDVTDYEDAQRYADEQCLMGCKLNEVSICEEIPF